MTATRTAPSTARTALIYTRISQDREGAGLGVDRQREDCEKLAATLGVTVADVYSDNDISASTFSRKRRPGYESMLGDIKAGRAGMVITWHTDRLHRRNAELERYIDLTNPLGIPTHSVKSGLLDLTTASGRLQARLAGAVASYQSEKAAENIQRKHQQSAKLGTWRGGTRPFGYRADMTVHPAEADMIRQAYADIIAARSLGSIVRRWNEAGVLSTTGGKWSYATLRQVLLRPRNYGASIYKGEIAGTGQWDAIIDEATWRTVRGILKDPARRRNASNVGIHLLAGLALCGVCNDGTTMISSTATVRGVKYPIYKCRSGKHLARRADYSDKLVTDMVFSIVSREDARDLLIPESGPDKPALSIKAMELRTKRAEAKQLWRDGVLTRAELTSEDAELRDKLAAIEARMADPDRARALRELVDAETPEEIAKVWDAKDWTQRRAAVDALMTVTVLPVPIGVRRRFDPRFVSIDPKR